MKYKKLVIILAAVLTLGTLTACGEDKKEEVENEVVKEEETQKEETNNEKEEETNDKEEEENNIPEAELTVEKDTATEFEEREEVERAIVQLETIEEKQFVNGHITITAGQDVDALAKEYKKILQENYPGRIVDLIISSDDKLLFQDTFE